mgnify:CR=1 FL=1
MKKILISLSALSGVAAFIVMLITLLGGISKTLLDSVTLTEEEKELISKLGDAKWTDYFFTILTLVVLLMAAIFITVVIFKDKSNFASASHIVSLMAMLMMFVCASSAFEQKTALLYNNVLVIVSLVLTVLMYAFLLFYSAVAITKEEFGRYL